MTNLPPVLYRGSVKNVRGEVSAENLVFEFSDRYSVFDWGEMPDQLHEKGKTLALMGKSFFKFLGEASSWENLFSSEVIKKRFSKNYLEILSQSDLYKKYLQEGLNHHAVLGVDDFHSPHMSVKNVSIIRPPFDGKDYHYGAYLDKPVNALVPLEVIFRLGLPKGNSLSKRLGTDLSLWRKFGFDEIPETGLLDIPVIDFSTKLERGDRYLSYEEAQLISGMTGNEWGSLQQMTHLIALNLFRFHSEMGLELWDGKIEVAFVPGENGERSFMLVDSIGIDELRLQYLSKSFSKEFLRESYKESPWYKNLEAAKLDSKTSGEDFKIICQNKYHSSPEKLQPQVLARAEAVYKSYANEVTSKVFGMKAFDEEFNLENYGKRFL